MSEDLWRDSVRNLDPYIPRQAAMEAEQQSKIKEVIRLATNENPHGPSQKAITAMQNAVLESHYYPDLTCLALRNKLGKLHGMDPENYVIANGADNIINLVIASYVNQGEEVVYCTPTFSEYNKNTLLVGGIPVEIPTTLDHKFDLEAILDAINERTKLVIICNPNNPTGTIVDEKELRTFLSRLPKHVIVVLDEAYGEFIAIPNYSTGVEYIQEGYPVITIRTFSKLFGLAGMRVGYAMAKGELIRPLQMVREPFACNRVAEAGAIASLEDVEYTEKVLAENRTEMVKMIKEFRSLGFSVEETHTNFLFIDMKQDTSKLAQKLCQKGLIIRPCAAWGFPTFARISIGSEVNNQKLIKALQEISSQTPNHV
ncbi:histidinol-phosphate transaminase [Neobacillus sp. M.A.Huq-85]|nr:histidinol-phosphate transaminase [Neobacillus cucumis]